MTLSLRLGFDAIRLAYNQTGLGNYSRFIVDALYDRFAAAQFFLYSPGVTELSEQFAAGKPRMQTRTPLRWQGGFWAKNIWRRSGIPGVCREDQIDLFHGLAAELPLFKPGAAPATVVTVHDLIYLRYPQYFPAIDRKLYDIRYRSAAKRADLIIAISQQTKLDLAEFFGTVDDKIRVVGQGCDPLFYQRLSVTDLVKVKKQYGLAKPFLLFVGNAEPRKNIELCLQAFAKSREAWGFDFVIVSRQTRHSGGLRQLAKELNVQERVQFLHKVPTPDLPALYQAAEAFLYPSRFEGFGIPILEAMASGTPVITARRSSLPEVGGDAVFYVGGEDPDELVAGLDRLIGDPQFRQEYANRGQARAQQFLPGRIADQIASVYRELC